MKRQVSYEIVHSDNERKIWKVTDQDTGKYINFMVSNIGEVSFNMCVRNFPYSQVLHELVCREDRRLHISIAKSNETCKRVIESLANVTKVPCTGISFQLYYLNP